MEIDPKKRPRSVQEWFKLLGLKSGNELYYWWKLLLILKKIDPIIGIVSIIVGIVGIIIAISEFSNNPSVPPVPNYGENEQEQQK